jgi:hypothetical protein
MSHRFPPAVYKCIIPVEKPLAGSSAICHSPLDDQSMKTAQSLPFPAWPAIEDSKQPLCLPTLMRAVYFEHRNAKEEPEECATRAEKYLSHPEIIEREISEQIIAFEKSQTTYFPMLPFRLMHLHGSANNHNDYVKKLTTLSDIDIDLFRRLGDSVVRVSEALMQAYIYGNLDNFYGEKEAFAAGHEFAHLCALCLRSGVVLDELSKRTHKTLDILATKRLSADQTAELWEIFDQTNQQIDNLVHKFEPIEEIFATYVGMRFLPTKVRNKIKVSVKQELIIRGWDKAYKAFAQLCNKYEPFAKAYNLIPIEEASFIFEYACRMLEQVDIDSTYLLYKLSEIFNIICPIKIKNQENAIKDELEIAKNEAAEKIDIILSE